MNTRRRLLAFLTVLAGALGLLLPSLAAQAEIARFDGPGAGDYHSVVIGGGDIDQDGTDDLIVGAPYSSVGAPSSGSVYAYSGADGSVIWETHHGTQDAHFGWSLALGENFYSWQTGDGTLYVGAPNDPGTNGVRCGAVYFLDVTTGSVFSQIHGCSNEGEQFGYSVAVVDLDHTGKQRPAIGAPGNDVGGVDAGMLAVLTQLNAMVVYGSAGDRLGTSMASGHFDLAFVDPYLDLVVGAPGYFQDRGIVLVYETDTFQTAAPIGSASGDQLGSSLGTVALAAGYDGFLAGEPFDDDAGANAGRVGLFRGWTEIGSWTGASAGDEFGSAVAGVGDLDGDGVADWVGSATQPIGPGVGTGYARAFSGQTALELWTVSGEAVPDSFGWRVSAAGDLNGDGVPDVAVGALGAANSMGRVQVFSGRCGEVASYCTPGTSASGCTPTLSTFGEPSASAPAGFLVLAAPTEGGKDGLFFFGQNGRQANPWGNGSSYQCVAPPVKRGGLISGSGPPGACSGVLSQDLNNYWQANPNKNPGAQAVVQLQCWYRDPFNTSNQSTSLSNAIEFIMCP